VSLPLLLVPPLSFALRVMVAEPVFPEGLKPYAQEIVSFLEKKTSSQCFIWMNSCYGACDLPLEVEKLGIDLIIQFGHSNWSYKKGVEVIK